jgi:hypothetical protein
MRLHQRTALGEQAGAGIYDRLEFDEKPPPSKIWAVNNIKS